ncbi:hypothetical protein J1614_002914 [Plenodomus biglobosus]|nr:hypothetical protein J1614_002914 [Plenodomus biglobosus]
MTAHTTAPLPHRRKRARFTPSDPSASDASTLAPTATPSMTTDASDLSLSDTDSELSSSSEEPSDESSEEEEEEEEEEDSDDDGDDDEHSTTSPPTTTTTTNPPPTQITNLRLNRGPKPAFKLNATEDLGPDIRAFLADFLPRLKAANEELEAQKRAGTLRGLEVEGEGEGGGEGEGEPYIEMDLGLGVLEVRGESDGSDGGESGIGGEGMDMEMDKGDGEEEKDVLGKLLGRDKAREKNDVGIEIVADEMQT